MQRLDKKREDYLKSVLGSMAFAKAAGLSYWQFARFVNLRCPPPAAGREDLRAVWCDLYPCRVKPREVPR
jgi:hypothetical protein